MKPLEVAIIYGIKSSLWSSSIKIEADEWSESMTFNKVILLLWPLLNPDWNGSFKLDK